MKTFSYIRYTGIVHVRYFLQTSCLLCHDNYSADANKKDIVCGWKWFIHSASLSLINIKSLFFVNINIFLSKYVSSKSKFLRCSTWLMTKFMLYPWIVSTLFHSSANSMLTTMKKYVYIAGWGWVRVLAVTSKSLRCLVYATIAECGREGIDLLWWCVRCMLWRICSAAGTIISPRGYPMVC